MTDFLKEFVGKYIRQEESSISGYKVTADRWNELWNLSIGASDHNTKAAEDIIAFLKSNFGTGLVAGENIHFTVDPSGKVVVNSSSTIAAADTTARADLATLQEEFDPVKAYAEANETNAITVQHTAISDQTPTEGQVLTYSEEEEKYIPKKLYLTEAEIFRVAPEDATTFSTFYIASGNNAWGMPKAYIPPKIDTLPTNGFYYCSAVNEIVFENPELITEIPQSFCRLAANLTKITPEVFKSVSSVAGNAFEGTALTGELVFGEDLTSIGSSAFQNTKITKVSFDSLKPKANYVLGSQCFSGCRELETVSLPEGLTSLSTNVFYYCTSLTGVTLPDGLTSIGNNTFQNCTSLTNVTLPDGLTSLGTSMFQGCTSLTEITLPDSLTSLGDSVFQGCTSLTDITLPDSLTSLGSTTFYDCTALTNLDLGSRQNVLTLSRSYLYLNSDNLTANSFLQVGNALVARTNTTARTIYVKTVAWGRLSSAQKAIFTNKNYTIEQT